LLEDEIVPAYYERDKNGVPKRWLELMKESMASTVWQFSTARMLQQYVDELYVPAAANGGGAPEALEAVGAGRGRTKS